MFSNVTIAGTMSSALEPALDIWGADQTMTTSSRGYVEADL